MVVGTNGSCVGSLELLLWKRTVSRSHARVLPSLLGKGFGWSYSCLEFLQSSEPACPSSKKENGARRCWIVPLSAQLGKDLCLFSLITKESLCFNPSRVDSWMKEGLVTQHHVVLASWSAHTAGPCTRPPTRWGLRKGWDPAWALCAKSSTITLSFIHQR